jgi:uncharacterized protein YodC (DUF2158 family)
MAEFKPGETVRLKSGGPLMTVKSISASSGDVWCEWFDDKDVPQGRGFQPTSVASDDGNIGV